MDFNDEELKKLENFNITKIELIELKNKKRFSKKNKWYWVLKENKSLYDAILLSKSEIPGTYEYFCYNKNSKYKEIITKNQWHEKYNKNKNTNTKENYIKRYGNILGKQKWDEYRNKIAATLKNFIKRHGDILGKQKWDEYRNKQAKSNTFEYKKAKYGWTKEQFDEYNKNRACTLENFIKRHGEIDGQRKWDNYVENQRDVGCSKKYFIEKYGKNDGTFIYKELNKKKAHTLENFILKYDDEIGLKKYTEYIDKKQCPYHSKIADELFLIISNKLLDLNYSQIYTNSFSKEWFIYKKGIDNIIFVDFFLREKCKVIEFNGDYWHANPNLYESGTIINYPYKKTRLVNDIWESDKKRIDLIKRIPYINDVLVIWEKDYRNNKNKIVEKCMNFLLQK